MKNSAFDEFIVNRCEEIIENDELHKELNKQILLTEERFKTALPPDKIKECNELEDLVIKLLAYEGNLLYRKGFNDRIRIG